MSLHLQDTFEKIVGFAHQPRIVFALLMMIISNLGWIMPLLIVPMEYVDVERKGIYILAWIIFGQVTYNVGFFIAGAQVIKKLRDKGITVHNIYMQISLFTKSITRRFPHL